MKITSALTDQAVLAELGQRIARRRLHFELTQAALAKEAGVAKRTLERVEAGESAQITTIIRLLRVLELLPGLDQLIPPAQPSPMEIMQGKRAARQRASGKRKQAETGASWSWDDEQ